MLRESGISTLDWSKHRQITTHPNAADDRDLGAPFILTSEQWAKDLKANDVLKQWVSQFPPAKEATSTKQTQAPVEASHGLSDIGANLQDSAAPADKLITGPLASIKHSVASAFFWGMMSLSSCVDYEPDYFGTVRYFHTGSTKVVLIPLAELTDAMSKASVLDAGCALSPSVVKSFMESNLTQDHVNKFAEHGGIAYTGTVESGHVLVTPPGYLMLTTTSEENVSGFRRSFLTARSVATKNFQSIITIADKLVADQLQPVREALVKAAAP